VDGHFQTKVPSIFAIGDAIDGPMLAHKAEVLMLAYYTLNIINFIVSTLNDRRCFYSRRKV